MFYIADLNRTYGDIVVEFSNSRPVISLFNRSDIEKVLQFNSGIKKKYIHFVDY